MTHLSQTEIEAFVTGNAPADERMRRHLRECRACAALLAREASLEETLHASTRRTGAPAAHASRRSRSREVWSAAAALAVVGLGAWFARAPRPEPETAAPRVSVSAPAAVDAPPGQMDPLMFAPGYEVVAPADYCRMVPPPPLEPGPPL